METEFIKRVKSLEIDFYDYESFLYSMPNRAFIYEYNDDYAIDISIENDTLSVDVWEGEEEYKLSESELDFVYEYLSKELESKIIETKEYYYNQKYEERYY